MRSARERPGRRPAGGRTGQARSSRGAAVVRAQAPASEGVGPVHVHLPAEAAIE